MINERTIQWGAKAPTKDDIEQVLDDFLAITFSIAWNSDRWVITLKGKETDGILRKESIIEIFPSQGTCNINTMHSDPITEAIANGIAKYVAYRLQGKQLYFCLSPISKR